MSSRSKGSNEQRTAREALADAGGTIQAPTWGEIRKRLNLSHMRTDNVEATFKALKGRGEVAHTVKDGNIVLVFT